MAEISRSALFGKLNKLAYRGIESATVFCKLRGNPYVELVHWIHQILQLQDSDLHRIVRQFNLNPSNLARDVTDALDRLPRGSTSISDLSSDVEEAVGGQVETIDLSGRSTGRSHYPIGAANCRSYLRRGSPLCHPAVMMRADALARCGGYRDRYGSAEDYDLWLRLAAEGDIDNLRQGVLRYRIHGENFTVRQTAENARDAALAYLAGWLVETLLRWAWRLKSQA